MRRVFWLFFLLFFVLSAYFAKLIFIDSDAIITNPYNARMKITDESIKRGVIVDANGNILAESKMSGDKYFREYPYGKVLCHVIGYSELGKSGIENKYNFPLQKVRFEIMQRLKNIAVDAEIEANNVVLTADADFSKYIREQLGDRNGSVVVMEPSTGKILSMVSYPNFNPETVGEDWNDLKTSDESPLINRAAQGLYIPGSTFKVITVAAAIENMEDWKEFTYECKGEEYFGENKLVCFNSKAHGLVDYRSAFALSCNTYFAHIGSEISPEIMRKTASSLYIDRPYDFILDYSKGSYTLGDDATVSETIETAIGQGKTLVSPLNMAMVASSVANGGLLMQPYIVDSLQSPDGHITQKFLPKTLGQVIDYSTADILKDMMVACVNEGTGAPASIKGVQAAGKTGTAQNPAGEDHSWFIGFAPADDPQIAFAVLLENSGGGGKALKLSKSILDYYFNR